MTPTSPQNITNVRQFQANTNGAHALLNGSPVRLLFTADVEGKSPCYGYIGLDGKTQWESMSQFSIIDTNLLPTSREALQSLGRESNSMR